MSWLDFLLSYFLLSLSPVPVIVSLSLSLCNDLCIQLFHFFPFSFLFLPFASFFLLVVFPFIV